MVVVFFPSKLKVIVIQNILVDVSSLVISVPDKEDNFLFP